MTDKFAAPAMIRFLFHHIVHIVYPFKEILLKTIDGYFYLDFEMNFYSNKARGRLRYFHIYVITRRLVVQTSHARDNNVYTALVV
jgi:hypothetical protein